MKKFLSILVLGSLLFGVTQVTSASVIMTNDRTSFEAIGTIDYNYGFDDFGPGFSYPGTPWTSHGVTYTSTENLIIGQGNGYYTTNGTPMMANNHWNPVTGNVDAIQQYDLFGFDAGYMHNDDISTTIRIMTNMTNYDFNVDLNSASNPAFYGFIADPGEYITSFIIKAQDSYSLPGMDNVTLGHANTTVPEPSTWLLICFGLIGMVGIKKKI